MRGPPFLLAKAQLELIQGQRHTVAFLGPKAELCQTHITLVAGANGTSKSRILASIVEALYEVRHRGLELSKKRSVPRGSHGLTCTGMETLLNGTESAFRLLPNAERNEQTSPINLPSRLLVLSNLVMDKFHFPRDEDNPEERFYHYLGVRQSTNLMTTGAMERSVSEAILAMISDAQRLALLQNWLELVFSSIPRLILDFPRLTISRIEDFVHNPNKTDFIHEKIQRRISSRRLVKTEDVDTKKIFDEISQLFHFLYRILKNENNAPENSLKKKNPSIYLDSLAKSDAEEFATLLPCLLSAQKLGLSAWPSLCIQTPDATLPFNQLSSGEQNLLSVGAKLIAHARPGCLIAIDEPEVSLNVAWQQRYMDLIRLSLECAPGSHVIMATHSPHFISSLPKGTASLITIEKHQGKLRFQTQDALFEGWGSESILYEVLGITSASDHHFHRELAAVLRHIQEGGNDQILLSTFLRKVEQLDYAGVEPLDLVISEIKAYLRGLN